MKKMSPKLIKAAIIATPTNGAMAQAFKAAAVNHGR